jgi:hypothetical protein
VRDIGVCNQCSRSLAGPEILYTPNGAVICSQCQLLGEVKQSTRKAAGNIRGAAFSCFGLSLVALLANPYFMVSAGAISAGIYSLRCLRQKDQFTAQLRGERGVLIGVACLGLVIAALPPAILLLAFVATRV